MRIEGLSNRFQNVGNEQQAKAENASGEKDFSQIMNMKNVSTRTVSLAKSVSQDLMRDFAEYYFKAGQTYEQAKSYRMAISAYEKSNSVSPSINTSKHVDSIRRQEFRHD